MSYSFVIGIACKNGSRVVSELPHDSAFKVTEKGRNTAATYVIAGRNRRFFFVRTEAFKSYFINITSCKQVKVVIIGSDYRVVIYTTNTMTGVIK